VINQYQSRILCALLDTVTYDPAAEKEIAREDAELVLVSLPHPFHHLTNHNFLIQIPSVSPCTEELIKNFVTTYNVDVNAKVGFYVDGSGFLALPPIVFAARTGDVNIFLFLLARGAKLDVRIDVEMCPIPTNQLANPIPYFSMLSYLSALGLR